MDTKSPEFQAALRDHARSLGVDPDSEAHLLALVQEALLAEVPQDWEQGETEDGTLYYFNEETGESIWEHPLDAHYRDLVKQKQAEGPSPKGSTVPTAPIPEPPQAPPQAPQAPQALGSEVSKLEVYSFDDYSDDDIKPLSTNSRRASADKASRISSLFVPQPAPSYSATSITTSARDPVASRTSTGNSGPTTTVATSSGGFGRDRSWLLDNDDDEIQTLPLSKPATSTTSSTVSSFTKPTEIMDLSSSSSSRLGSTTSSATASSMSYTARLFGGTSTSASTPVSTVISTPIETSITPLNIGGSSVSGNSSKTSPRRGIASAIKGPFFQDMTATPGAAETTVATTGGMSSAADLVKIKDLEKTNGELRKEADQLKKELKTTKQQLETAKQDAQEANYLKMKANESKTKLGEKDNALNTAKQETAKLQELVTRLQEEGAALKQVQKTATQHEILEAKKAVSDLEALLHTSQKQASDAQEELQRSRQDVEKLSSQLKDVVASSEREKVEAAILKEQYAGEQKETRALRDQLERVQLEAVDHVEKMKRELSDQSQKFESVALLQETIDRQTKYVKELEDRQKGLVSKVEDAEGKEAQAIRAIKLKDFEVQDFGRKITTLTEELEARDKQLGDLMDKLRSEQANASAIQSKALSFQRTEDEFDRQKQLLVHDKQELVNQLRERRDQIQSLQSQLQKAQEDHVGAMTKLQMETHALSAQLKQVTTHEVVPLEKQRDQLTHEADRQREKLTAVEKELRTVQQDFTNETSKNHQLQIEIESWKRKEQQQKAQKETYLLEKMTTEKQLQSLQAETSSYQHDKRLEIDKLTFRLRELESQVAQKDYEIVRVEEKFTKAESWRLKEARRVEDREAQVLDLKEELAQLKSRNIDAENNVIIHELRREKDQLNVKLQTLTRDLEDERIGRQVAAQKFQDDVDNLQKAIEWQLPQLAAACVSRSSEEWTRKCHEIVQAQRDDWSMKALTERNELVQRLKETDERRDHVEQKLKNVIAECEFLRKEVHRVEDNNKVLLDQLHTVRVYMMQRAGASVFPTGMGSVQSNASAAPPPPPPSAPPSAAHPPHTAYSDSTAVNQLNTQLAVLHSQFQQLFDAHAEPRSFRPVVNVFSPSDRFEIPSSPPTQPRKTRPSSRNETPLNTSCTSTASSSPSIDETLDSLLLKKTYVVNRKDPHKEKEDLLATLEAIGSTTSLSSAASPMSLVSMGGGDPADTMWYQKNYWRSKYQQ